MTFKQRFSIGMMILWGVILVALPIWMIVTCSGRLWAAEVAVLCLFAASLRTYALEWRRLRDERDEKERRR